jgi:hypothetical protein
MTSKYFRIGKHMKRDANAMAVVALVFLIVAAVGFTPKYFGPMAGGSFVSPSVWMHPHAFASMLFLLVFLVQPMFIAAGAMRLHRTVGVAALVIAAANAVTGFLLQMDLLPVAAGSADLAAFTARFVSGLGVFVPAVILGYVFRRRTDVHLRLMYIAAMSVMPSPFGRILIHYVGISPAAAGPMTAGINVLLALAIPIYDRLTRGRVTIVGWLGPAAVIVSQLIFLGLFGSAWWVDLLSR